MSEPIIKAEGLGKKYIISHEKAGGYTALRDVITQKAKGLVKGKLNGLPAKEEFWALKDVNFEIPRGEAVGIIGRNGAGKSTLLKILSRITEPSTGRIELNGRVASLLEVGTGFHPELTGRENIFLNGAILGMSRAEIKQKFDEIVDFSGVEKFLDTPVKRYSSGMYVRLAFAVAAHLEPEILVVDEVLAVGDAEFQKKCLGKMEDVSRKEGRTVLFVSHNMGAIASLCNEVILLRNGMLAYRGGIQQGIDLYLGSGMAESAMDAVYENEHPKNFDILRMRLLNDKGEVTSHFNFSEPIHLEITLRCTEIQEEALLGFRVKDQLERNIFTSEYPVKKKYRGEKEISFTTTIPPRVLVPNTYTPLVNMHVPNKEIISYLENKLQFVVEETGTDFFQYQGKDYGCVFIECDWN